VDARALRRDYELDDTPNIDIDGMRMSKLFNSVDEATQAQKHELKLYAESPLLCFRACKRQRLLMPTRCLLYSTNAFELIGMSGTLDLGKMLRKSSTSISTLKKYAVVVVVVGDRTTVLTLLQRMPTNGWRAASRDSHPSTQLRRSLRAWRRCYGLSCRTACITNTTTAATGYGNVVGLLLLLLFLALMPVRSPVGGNR